MRMRTRLAALGFLLAPFFVLQPGVAQPVGPTDTQSGGPVLPVDSNPRLVRAAARTRLQHVLTALGGNFDNLDSIRFSETFLVHTPREQALESIKSSASAGGYEVLETRFFDAGSIGAWLRAKTEPSKFLTVRLSVETIQPHRINSLEIKDAVPPGAATKPDWEGLDALAGSQTFDTAIAVMERRADGSVTMIHERSPDSRMGLGALGTLFAHLALSEWIAEGGSTWDSPLAIDDSLRSLPDSRTSLLAAGTVLPLSEYSHRAMGENDNTCADHLITYLGRERIERSRDLVRAAAEQPAGNALPGGEPFISVMENYRLKCGVTMLIKHYAEADNAERRRMLEDEVAKAEVHPTFLRLWSKPQELDRVGWTATARELCFAGARLIELSEGGAGRWALDALRVPDRDEKPGTLTKVAGRAAGEPGAQAGIWIVPKGEGRMVIAAYICNSRQSSLSSDQVSKISTKLLSTASGMP